MSAYEYYVDSPDDQIIIQPSDRVLIVGTTGSGKSYLTRHTLLPKFAVRPVVFDPKERWDDENGKVVGSFRRSVPYQIIRLGEYDERNGPELWDEQAQRVLRDAPHTLIDDELTLTTRSQGLPPVQGRVMRTGRDTKGGSVGMWALTQQPVRIPTAVWALTEHKFFFMQENEDDIKVIGRRTTPDLVPIIRELYKYDYVYYNRERRLIVPVIHDRRTRRSRS